MGTLKQATPTAPDADLSHLLTSLGQIILQARQRAMQAVDVVQVQTCWELGRHIVEFEQAGQTCATCGPSMELARFGTHCVPN